MNVLYINTCSGDILIKLFKNGKVYKEESVLGQIKNSQFIMPSIKKVLLNETLDKILVVSGPGSFTGVRLGVTVAKTLAYMKNIPIISITTLEEIAFSVHEKNEIIGYKEYNGYFIGIFDDNDNLVGEYKYLSNKEYEEFTSKYKVITDVNVDYNKVYKRAMKKEPTNPHEVKPTYVKLIEALK